MNFDNSYSTLDPRLYNKQPPTPLENPRKGHFNPIVASQIGWSDDKFLMDNWVDIIGGKIVPDGFDPLAMAYAGHQFGQWAGQLGDGRGLLMAQVRDKTGQLTDLHLKGMGLTPYSRMGDGRAVLRSTIREYLCGHAMSQLGINSTNALGFVVSDTPVRRERMEAGAALMRVSDCHIRLGHIEWVASFAPDLLPSFTDYMIDTYYPMCRESKTPVVSFLTQVVERTAKMIANWQLIGFAHGVMNTDNLSITGSTIDYGPFGFLERFNPAWINNHSDYTGRYSYQNQPAIGHWNLNVWLTHFLRLSSSGVTRNALEQTLSQYEVCFQEHYQQGICNKLGMPYTTDGDDPNYKYNAKSLELAFEFLSIVEHNRLDYTNSFRAVGGLLASQVAPNNVALNTIVLNNKDNINDSDESSRSSQSHDIKMLDYLESELNEAQQSIWAQWKLNYLIHLLDAGGYDCSQNSVDNIANLTLTDSARSHLRDALDKCNRHNPIYILRNSMAQRAIIAAEADDFDEVDRLFELLSTPYTINNAVAIDSDTLPPAPDAPDLIISCSS